MREQEFQINNLVNSNRIMQVELTMLRNENLGGSSQKGGKNQDIFSDKTGLTKATSEHPASQVPDDNLVSLLNQSESALQLQLLKR